MEVDFKEFDVLLKMNCGFRDLSQLEIDEIFKFLDCNSEDRISKENFLKIFGDWKPLNPVKFNRKYFEKLSERQLRYYKKNHHVSLNKNSPRHGDRTARMRLYDKDDDDFYEIDKKYEDIYRPKKNIMRENKSEVRLDRKVPINQDREWKRKEK